MYISVQHGSVQHSNVHYGSVYYNSVEYSTMYRTVQCTAQHNVYSTPCLPAGMSGAVTQGATEEFAVRSV